MKKFRDLIRLSKMYQSASVHVAWFKVVENIMHFVTEVQENKRPMLTKIAVMDLSKEKIIGDFDMVSIWAGVGDANPIERSRHLKAQNIALKELLVTCQTKLQPGQDDNLLLNIKLVLDTFE